MSSSKHRKEKQSVAEEDGGDGSDSIAESAPQRTKRKRQEPAADDDVDSEVAPPSEESSAEPAAAGGEKKKRRKTKKSHKNRPVAPEVSLEEEDIAARKALKKLKKAQRRSQPPALPADAANADAEAATENEVESKAPNTDPLPEDSSSAAGPEPTEAPSANGEKKQKKKKRKHVDADDESNNKAVPQQVDTTEEDEVAADAEEKREQEDSEIQEEESKQSADHGDEEPAEDPEADRFEDQKAEAEAEAEAEKHTLSVAPGWMERGRVIADSIGVKVDEKGQVSAKITRYPVEMFHFHPAIVTALKKMGIRTLFPVQKEVIPVIMRAHIASDVCVSAPTGSGKTLTYVLPIVQTLCTRVVPRLRALIILPTRDLVLQVKSVFERFCGPLGLKVESAIGQSSFATEQRRLVGSTDPLDPFAELGSGSLTPAGGRSAIDILVATPGRLVDHLQGTPGFTLQHLQFLVIDEADRLLTQQYQDWVHRVLQAAHKTDAPSLSLDKLRNPSTGALLQIPVTTIRSPFQRDHQTTPLQKLLFSATLTRNPQKLASLSLRNPLYFSGMAGHSTTVTTSDIKSAEDANKADGADADSTAVTPDLLGKKYSIPPTLKESMVVCELGDKPLILLHLLEQAQQRAKEKKVPSPVICFTASIDSTHRLCRLLELMGVVKVAEYSSNLPQEKRTRILKKLRDGSLEVVVCSDALARGMDLEFVDSVVNYDVPVYIKTYIHRVGRTARAGKEGHAITLLRRQEVRHLKEILQKAEGSNLRALKVPEQALKTHVETYQRALEQLKSVLQQEKFGKVDPLSALPAELLLPRGGCRERGGGRRVNERG